MKYEISTEDATPTNTLWTKQGCLSTDPTTPVYRSDYACLQIRLRLSTDSTTPPMLMQVFRYTRQSLYKTTHSWCTGRHILDVQDDTFLMYKTTHSWCTRQHIQTLPSKQAQSAAKMPKKAVLDNSLRCTIVPHHHHHDFKQIPWCGKMHTKYVTTK